MVENLLNNFSDVEFYNHVLIGICFWFVHNLFCFHILVKNVASSVKSQLQSEPFFTRQDNKINMIALKRFKSIVI